MDSYGFVTKLAVVPLNFSTFDVIHILTIVVLIPLIGTLLYKGWNLISNQLLAFFLFAQILASLDQLCWSNFKNTYDVYPYLAYIAVPFFAIWGPSMYLYITSEATAKFRIKPLHLLHYLPFLLCSIYFLFAFHIHSIEEKRQLLHSQHVFDYTFRAYYSTFIALQVFIYNVSSIYTIELFARDKSPKSGSQLTRLKWNRFIIYGYFLACVFNNLASFIYLLAETREALNYFYISALLFLAYFSVVLCNALLGSQFGDQLKKTRAMTLSDEQIEKLHTTLEPYMADHKPFLQFNLTLSELASQIGFKDRQLSEYINTYCYTTFQDYLNGYRINEAKQLIQESINSRKTMLEIAYESGFNSKSAFNFAFKKHSRTTPTRYKKSLKTISA